MVKEFFKTLKNMINRFFTLNVHEHKGFTLVELIIVIAILAILSSVAVVGYSSYVKKANMQADKTLVADLKNTLLLAFYAGELDASGWIHLKADGADIGKDTTDGDLDAVLTEAYGSNWRTTLKLKYSEWQGGAPGSYNGTSYKGNENSLLLEVNKLTDALSNAVADGFDLGDGEFSQLLEDYGYDENSGEAVGNVAVLYVANKTQNQGELIENTFKTYFTASTMASQNGALGALSDTFNTLAPKIGDAAALAVLYAYAEGYAQYYDTLGITNPKGSAVTVFHEKTAFTNTKNTDDALNSIIGGFGSLWTDFGNTSDASRPLDAYVAEDGMGLKNLNGYVNIMGTVVDNKEAVEGNLGAEDCFTDGTVANLLNAYAALSELNIYTNGGEVAVAILVANGEAMLYVLPLNLE